MNTNPKKLSSDTPRTDAMIASVQGGMFPDKSDGITAEEDYADKSEALCRQLERELYQLQGSFEQLKDKPIHDIKLAGKVGFLSYQELEQQLLQLQRSNAELRYALEVIKDDFRKRNISQGNYSDGEYTQDYTTRLELVVRALSSPPTTADFVVFGKGELEMIKSVLDYFLTHDINDSIWLDQAKRVHARLQQLISEGGGK